jgi:hypothetical protein
MDPAGSDFKRKPRGASGQWGLLSPASTSISGKLAHPPQQLAFAAFHPASIAACCSRASPSALTAPLASINRQRQPAGTRTTFMEAAAAPSPRVQDDDVTG